MRKVLIIALLIAGCVFAQEEKKSFLDGFSFSLGINSSQIKGNLEDKIFLVGQEENKQIGFVYGWQKILKNDLRVEIGIRFRGANYGYNNGLAGAHKTSIQLNYITLNISKPYTIYKIKILPYHKSKSKINFPIKLAISFLVDGKYDYKKHNFNIFNNEDISISTEIKKLNVNKFDLGIPIGIELEYEDKLSICVDYYIGHIDIFNDVKSKNHSLQYYLRYKLS